ncbi:MAG: hypothetical protein ACT4P5_01030, partial [Armatimonadota bacterium]
MRRKPFLIVISLVLALAVLVSPGLLVASDHDDGETDLKGRALNLTDLYVFREIDQLSAQMRPAGGVPAGDLVFVMNTNP